MQIFGANPWDAYSQTIPPLADLCSHDFTSNFVSTLYIVEEAGSQQKIRRARDGSFLPPLLSTTEFETSPCSKWFALRVWV
jgi:hypothetical protein